MKAPLEVELEIRNVWQEDEMPDEIKNAPGYRPFMLGIDAQAWVDSMAEIADGGDAVYGRPKPIAPQQHPSLTPLPPFPSQPTVTTTPPPLPPAGYPVSVPSPPAPPVLMPDIDGAPPPPRPRTLPRRVTMPDIGDDEEPPKPKPPRPLMPDIG